MCSTFDPAGEGTTKRRRKHDRFVRNDVTRTLGCPIVERSRRDTGALAEARRFREKIDPSDGSPDFQGEPFKTILRNPTFHWITVSRQIILSMRLQTLSRGICCVPRIPDCTAPEVTNERFVVRGSYKQNGLFYLLARVESTET